MFFEKKYIGFKLFFQIQLYKKNWKKFPTIYFPLRTFHQRLTVLKMKHNNVMHCGATSAKGWI